LEKPEKLAALGRLSIGDVRSARFPDEIKKTVRDWSESVWEAYASQQALARTWLDLAVTGKPAGGSKRAARRR
jgi:hypothetical protein